MKTSSAKAKGRKLQQWLASFLIETANECAITLTPKDIRSTSMGVGGPDLQLSEYATTIFPFDFECKNEANPKNIYGRFFKFEAKHQLPTVALFKRTSRTNSAEPLFVLSHSGFNQITPNEAPIDFRIILDNRCDLYETFYKLDDSSLWVLTYNKQVNGIRNGWPVYVMATDTFKFILKNHLTERITNGHINGS